MLPRTAASKLNPDIRFSLCLGQTDGTGMLQQLAGSNRVAAHTPPSVGCPIFNKDGPVSLVNRDAICPKGSDDVHSRVIRMPLTLRLGLARWTDCA